MGDQYLAAVFMSCFGVGDQLASALQSFTLAKLVAFFASHRFL
jgi:hypothetical protein